MDPKSPIYLNYIILMLFFHTGFCCKEFFDRSTQGKPKTHVTSAPEHLHDVNGNGSVILIDGIGIEVRIDCWAPYPIDFRFKGHLTNRGATVGLIERTAEDVNDPSTFCFHINVTLLAYEEITGEYICLAVQNETLYTSHYVYHAAHPPEALPNRNQTLRVMYKPKEKWTGVPCPSTNPNVTVYLYKEVGGNMIPIKVDGDLVTYDPQVGFRLRTNLLEPNIPRLMRCATELSPLDFVNIVLVQPKAVIVTPPQKILLMTEGQSLRLTCEGSQPLQFESSNSNLKAKLSKETKDNGAITVHIYEILKLKEGDGGVISCESEDGAAKQTFHEWSFTTKENRVTTSKTMTGQGHAILDSQECQLANGRMQIALFDCNNWIECNLRKCNYLDRKCDRISCDSAQTRHCVSSGVIQCFNINNENAQTQIFFSGLQNKRTYTNWESAAGHAILKITPGRKFLAHSITEKEKIQAMEIELVCEGSAFVFAVGFKWFIQSKDSTIGLTPISSEFIQQKWRHLDRKNIIQSIAKLNVTHESDIIICKAPVWNTTEWKQDSFNISNLDKDGIFTKLGSSTISNHSTAYNFYLAVLILVTLLLNLI